ncbi:MAG: hypothetical protein OXG91_10865 [bacterium]|nr:hypothetical protein [bacterium]
MSMPEVARPRGGAADEGHPAQQEFEYRRHGTKALFAAFGCAGGAAAAAPTDSIRSDNFVLLSDDDGQTITAIVTITDVAKYLYENAD